MQAAQSIPLSPTVQIVNQSFDFSPASFEELSPESQSILDSLMPPPTPRTSSPAGVGKKKEQGKKITPDTFI